MFKFITEIQSGDIIIEGPNRTTVKKVDTETCKNKVHINDKDCYEAMAEVRVQG